MSLTPANSRALRLQEGPCRLLFHSSLSVLFQDAPAGRVCRSAGRERTVPTWQPTTRADVFVAHLFQEAEDEGFPRWPGRQLVQGGVDPRGVPRAKKSPASGAVLLKFPTSSEAWWTPTAVLRKSR